MAELPQPMWSFSRKRRVLEELQGWKSLRVSRLLIACCGGQGRTGGACAQAVIARHAAFAPAA